MKSAGTALARYSKEEAGMEKRFFTWMHQFGVMVLVMSFDACAATGQGLNGEAGTGSARQLQDDQILHTFLTINQGEVITSRKVADISGRVMSDSMALVHDITLTEDPSIDTRAFARLMVAYHSSVAEEIRSIAADLGLDLQPNQVSMALENTAEGIAERMEVFSGEQEEVEYIRAQIALHENALNMLDHTLIPQTDDPQLRQRLQVWRQDIADHLLLAQQIYDNRLMQAVMD